MNQLKDKIEIVRVSIVVFNKDVGYEITYGDDMHTLFWEETFLHVGNGMFVGFHTLMPLGAMWHANLDPISPIDVCYESVMYKIVYEDKT